MIKVINFLLLLIVVSGIILLFADCPDDYPLKSYIISRLTVLAVAASAWGGHCWLSRKFKF